MHIAVAEENLVLIAELVIEAAGCLVLARVERSTPPLVLTGCSGTHSARSARIQTRSRKYSQSAGQRGAQSRGRYCGPPG